MAGPDFDTEIEQLQATMRTIEQVLDVDAMRKEIADLGNRSPRPTCGTTRTTPLA